MRLSQGATRGRCRDVRLFLYPEPFDGFEVTPASRFAHAVAAAVAEAPGEAYNPVVMWGPSGSGKSHLLRAIHETVAGAGSPKVRAMSGLGLIEALDDPDSCLEDADVVLIDDLDLQQFSVVKEALRALASQQVQIVAALRADRAVRDIYAWGETIEQSLIVDCHLKDAWDAPATSRDGSRST